MPKIKRHLQGYLTAARRREMVRRFHRNLHTPTKITIRAGFVNESTEAQLL